MATCTISVYALVEARVMKGHKYQGAETGDWNLGVLVMHKDTGGVRSQARASNRQAVAHQMVSRIKDGNRQVSAMCRHQGRHWGSRILVRSPCQS